MAAPTVASTERTRQTPTATEVGVTDTTIRIAVVADVDNQFSPGVFQGSVDGVRGWAKYVNAHGGLAHRQVVVDFIDSHLTATDSRTAAIKACQQDFALVGTSAVFLNNVDDIQACADTSPGKGRRTLNPAPSSWRCAVTTRATGRGRDPAGSGRGMRGRTSVSSTVMAGIGSPRAARPARL